MSIYRAGVPARVYIGDTLAQAVFRGETLIWLRDHEAREISIARTFTLVAPTYCALLDLAVIGGGGGGSTADNGATTANGKGGNPATWQYTTVAVKPGDQFTFTLGDGGAGGSGGVKKSGSNGGPSTVTGPGVNLTSPGGTGAPGGTGNYNVTGLSSTGLTTPAGHILRASGTVGASATGEEPGGGGGGSAYKGWFQTPANAGAGGNGIGAYRIRSY